jgi:hypothetical protein
VYLRFVVQRVTEGSAYREGVFQTAYDLCESDVIPDPDRQAISDLLEWFRRNLPTPDRFNRTTSKGYYRRNTRGLSWLKPTATQHLQKMRQLTEVLHRHDHSTEMLATERPGYVVYEDQFQVIAEPFKDTPS